MLLSEILPQKIPLIQNLYYMLRETGREDIVSAIREEGETKARYVDVSSEKGTKLSSTSKVI